jgi:tetratricopeptide (TPR) repeat protein
LLVAHVLEGSIRKSGDQMRITAQLIRASDGYELWSKTFDRKIDDIFKIQDEIAASVVDALKVTLLGAVPKARETDPRAYALYLQAIQLGNQLTIETLGKSDELHRQVLDIDPRYVGAWVGLARNALRATQIGMVPTTVGFARGREAVAKALEIDPDYAPAQAAAARISIYGDNDLAAGARYLQRALAIDPVNIESLRAAAVLLSDLGRADQALALGVAILGRDPIDVDAWHNRGLQELATQRYDDASASFRTALNLTPARGEEHFMLGLSLLLKGDATDALAQIEHESSEAWRLIGLAIAYQALGRTAEADASLAAVIEKYEKDATYNVAQVYAMRGDADNAFAWLDKAIEYQDPGLGEILLDGTMIKIRSDARWLPFLRRIGRAPEQVDRIDFTVAVNARLLSRFASPEQG